MALLGGLTGGLLGGGSGGGATDDLLGGLLGGVLGSVTDVLDGVLGDGVGDIVTDLAPEGLLDDLLGSLGDSAGDGLPIGILDELLGAGALNLGQFQNAIGLGGNLDLGLLDGILNNSTQLTDLEGVLDNVFTTVSGGGVRLDLTAVQDLTPGDLQLLSIYVTNVAAALIATPETGLDLDGVLNALLTGDDNLADNNMSHLMRGGAGDDTLNGMGGQDTLDGGTGHDLLIGGTGADSLIGGTGNDSFQVDNVGDRVIEANNEGTDTVFASFNFSLAAGQSVEFLRAATPSATSALTLTGNELVNFIYGNAGANVLAGGGGGDALYGGRGADNLNGGDGIDYARYDDANYGDLRISLAGPSVNTGAAAGDRYTSIEGVVGGVGDDIIGGAGGVNYLFGGAGDDILSGNLGNDQLSGQFGNDTFLFNTALNANTNVDSIRDFNVADDQIALDNAIFTRLGAAGELNASFFKAGPATDANDYVLYDKASGGLFYDADGSGAGAAIKFAGVTAGLSLTVADFDVV